MSSLIPYRRRVFDEDDEIYPAPYAPRPIIVDRGCYQPRLTPQELIAMVDPQLAAEVANTRTAHHVQEIALNSKVATIFASQGWGTKISRVARAFSGFFGGKTKTETIKIEPIKYRR